MSPRAAALILALPVTAGAQAPPPIPKEASALASLEGVSAKWIPWEIPAAPGNARPALFDVDSNSDYWIGFPGRTLVNATEGKSFRTQVPLDGFVWLDNSEFVACAGTRIGSLQTRSRDGGPGASGETLAFNPSLDLKHGDCRLYPAGGNSAYLATAASGGKDALFKLSLGPGGRGSLDPVHSARKRITGAAGNEAGTFVALGKEVLRVAGNSRETYFQSPEEITSLTLVAGLGLLYSTPKGAGLATEEFIIDFLPLPGIVPRAGREEIVFFVPDKGGSLEVVGLDRIKDMNPRSLAAKGFPTRPRRSPETSLGSHPPPVASPEAPEPALEELPKQRGAPLIPWLLGGATLVFGSLAVSILLKNRGDAEEKDSGPAAESGTPLLARKYELREKIGEGGMGLVFQGYDRALRRKVAIKEMRPELRADAKERERFIKEARIISQMNHPYIVGIHDIFEQDGELYLVFDYVDGKPLSSIIEESGRLTLEQCLGIFRCVCPAVEFAHQSSVLHSDLKPANIMVDSNGFAKVMDFGLARELQATMSKLSLTASPGGTLAYMAPEQHVGRAGRPSDVYALGVCLYEMLAGKRPFSGPDFLAQKERMDFPPLETAAPGLPAGIGTLLTAVLDPNPRRRTESPEAFLKALEGVG